MKCRVDMPNGIPGDTCFFPYSGTIGYGKSLIKRELSGIKNLGAHFWTGVLIIRKYMVRLCLAKRLQTYQLIISSIRTLSPGKMPNGMSSSKEYISLYFLIDIPQKQPILGTLWKAYSSLTSRSMSEKCICSVAKCFFSG